MSFSGSASIFSAAVAPYHVDKTLTINPDDMYAALDSFFATPPDCFLTEPYFIRRSVESKTFPCPTILTGCDDKKMQMMEELFPGAKYGQYGISGGVVTGTSNSIFTIISSGGVQTYRYLDTCTAPTLPDTITVGGVFYNDLRTMHADSFIYVYNKAIGLHDYRIAEDLLPLHPEYCELQACFDDTFKTQVTAIPNAKIADNLNLLYLDSIVAHDPFVGIMMSYSYPYAADSLKTFTGGHTRLDSLIIVRAYCGCDDSVMFSECTNGMFRSEIVNRILINDNVKNYYFNNLVSLYFLNRQRFVDAITMSKGDSCYHCALVRMTLIPSPVFDDLVSGTGAPVYDSISTASSFSGTSSLSWVGSAIGGVAAGSPVDSMDSTLVALYDSSMAGYHFADSALCYGQTDTILARLSNCIGGDSTLMAAIANTLDSLCAAHAVTNGNYTPSLIRYVLTRNGISLTDLCNPYVVGYSYLTFTPPPTMDCMQDTFYTSCGDYLSGDHILAALGNPGTAYLDTLNAMGNILEGNVSAQLGGNIYVKDFAAYDATHKLITLSIYNNPSVGGVSLTDTVKIFLRSPIFGNVFSIPGDSFSVSVACINTYPQPTSAGFINEYSFVANVSVYSDSVDFSCSMLCWIDSIQVMNDMNNNLASCIPCTELRALYNQFNDTLLSYGIVGIDHPYYEQMLTSFVNYNMQKCYSVDEYENFIQSCALADSLKMPLYVGYSTFVFENSTDLSTFLNALNNVDTDYSFDDSYRDSAAGKTTICVNVNQVPLTELWKYKNFF